MSIEFISFFLILELISEFIKLKNLFTSPLTPHKPTNQYKAIRTV